MPVFECRMSVKDDGTEPQKSSNSNININDNPTTKSLVPNDPYNLVFIICLVLGSGTLLSYNCLVSCATYFNHQFTEYPAIMFIIVPVYSIPNLMFNVLMIPFGDRFSCAISLHLLYHPQIMYLVWNNLNLMAYFCSLSC